MKRVMRRSILGLSALALMFMATPARADCPADVGAALAAACPCSGPATGGTWKNHGQHQKCVVHFRNNLRKHHCLTAATQNKVASCSARSTCGKADAVLCCVVSGTGTCNDPTPGNGSKDGTCSNDATVACDTAADCTALKGPKVRRNATACTDRGGYVSGTGSVCGGCTAPVACCLASGCAVLTAADCTTQGGTTPAGSVPSCTPNPCP